MWHWLGRNHVQIQILFAVIAAFYAVTEYRGKIHGDKVDKALAYIEKHGEGRVLEARMRLYQFWISDKMEEWIKQLRREASNEVRFTRYEKELPDLIKSEKLGPDVYLLLEYYDSVALCTKSSLCDSETICQNLFDDIQGYRQNYKALLRKWKSDLGATPDGIAYLTEQTCSVQFANYCKAAPSTSNCPKDDSASP